MNTIIELHDSTVAEIIALDGNVVVHFQPAYLHKSEARPGLDAGTGWIQNAKMTFANSSISGRIPELPCDILDGELTVGEKTFDNEIPVPLDATGPAQLRLVFDSIYKVTIDGHAPRLELVGEPTFVEEFKP